MADETGEESTSKPEPTPGPTSLRQEKPVIEGQIVHEDRGHEDKGHDEVPSDTEGSEKRSEPSPEETAAAPARETAARRRGPLWPIAAAVVIGAGLAVGGAFLLRMSDATTSDTVAALAQRNEALAERLTTLEKKPDISASLADTLAGQSKRLRAAEERADKAVDAANSALAAAQATNAPAPATSAPQTVDLAPTEARIDALERRLDGIEQKLAQLSAPAKADIRAPEDKAVRPPAQANAEAVAIIAASLVGKVERGSPYASELAALANHGVDKSKLAALEPAAATGVATTRALADQFAALSDKLTASESEQSGSQESGSFLDRLGQSARRLVHFRKSGEGPSESSSGRISRIKAALAAGSLEDALTQWDALPTSAKATSQGFAEALKGRLDAVAAARAIQSDAVAALSKTKS